MAKLTVVGIDPSLRNTGLVKMVYDTESGECELLDTLLVKTEASSDKTVRTSNKDYKRAKSLAKALIDFVKQSDLVIAELPIGSQSARAMASYGVVIGLLAGILGDDLISVNPTEVKEVTGLGKTATKRQMIEWAYSKYPDNVKWLMSGTRLINDNEHLADAVAVVHAGLRLPEVRFYLNKLNQE